MKKLLSVFTNEQFIKRLKAFGWSAFWVGVAAVADHSLANLGVLSLPNISVLGQNVDSAIIFGLILNQVSKHAHNMNRSK